VLRCWASIQRWLPSSLQRRARIGQDRALRLPRPSGLDSTNFLRQCLRLPVVVCPTPNRTSSSSLAWRGEMICFELQRLCDAVGWSRPALPPRAQGA